MRGAGVSLAGLAAAGNVAVERASMVSVEAVKAAEAEVVVARAAAVLIASAHWTATPAGLGFVRSLILFGLGKSPGRER